ncbi:MAG: HYR domain-containing protein [Algibacter sp.]
MKLFKSLAKVLCLRSINAFVVFILFSTALFAQNSPYQAIRLNNGDPIIEPSMFSNPDDGDNINGPSLIRVPDWIPTNERADPSAQYYLYFAHHVGDYIRMAWAANIEGPYTLYDDYTTPGNRGVLDNNESNIILGNNTYIEENHLASPDVIVDDANQRIILYFHSGSSYFVNGAEQNDQVTWVSTSPYGLEFYDNIESVHLGSSYFRVFEHGGEMYALDNGSKINKALDGANPWVAPQGHDFTDHLWDQASDHVFQDDILPLTSSDLRVRHTGVHVVGNQLQAFYSRRGEFQERIQLSTVDMSVDWESWDPTYPPIEILAPNPGWEGGERTLDNSETSAGVDLNQLRDPDIFEDADGQLYLVYTGNGEGGLGIAKLYETPTYDTTLTTIADTYAKESSSNSFGTLNNLTASAGSSSSSNRTIYMRFDLSEVTDIEHAIVRLYANTTNSGTSVLDAGGPITVYETSNNWDELTLNNSNAPALGNVITTTYLTDASQYYEWNISEYAKANEGTEISVAFHIGPSNTASHKFNSRENSGGNPAQLLITGTSEPTDNEDPTIACISDINQNNDANEDGAIVTYVAPVGTDNLAGATTVQTEGLASGSLFPIGTTTNTFVVTDAAGNTATCSFAITITDDEDPTIACLAAIAQSTDIGADGSIITYITPVGTDNSTGANTIQTEGLTSGSLFPIGTTTNTFVVTDPSGNTATCSFTVTITDDENPAIICLADTNQTADTGSDGAIITYTAPIGTDNSTGANTVQTEGLASGALFPIGSTTNTFIVTDTSGNTATCSFTVTVIYADDVDPTIVCVNPINQSTDTGIDGAIITYTAPIGTDNSTGANTVQTEGLASGALFPIGVTTNTFVVTDTSGNTATCSFTITVTDDEDPIIACLSDITQTTDTGDNGAIVNFTAPLGTDNSTGANTVQTQGLASGSLFPIGTTTNTFVVSDTSGNTATCSFTVTVTDDEDPTIACLSDITQTTDTGANGAIVTFAAPVGTDNSTGANTVQTQGLASGSLFPIGATTNTFVVTDTSGNTGTCNFTVTVTEEVNTCDILINENNFDSSWGIWNDGGADCRRNSKDAAFANGGTGRSVRLRDNTSTSVTTTDALDLSTYTEITVDFNFIADQVESGEDFWLQISTDGGGTYQTVGDWDANDEFVNGTRYFESVTIQGSFPTNTYLRFRMDASANADLIYIDDVKITGCSSSTTTSKNTSTTKEVISDKTELNQLTLVAYPNPFVDNFTIEVPNYDGQSAVVVELISLSGRVLVSKETYNQSAIEFKDMALPIGAYVIRVSYNNGKSLMKKLIKVD